MTIALRDIRTISELFDNYPALPYEDREQLPEEQGVYFVTNGINEVIYVGKTKNFRTRWVSHHKLSDIKNNYPISQLLIVFCETAANKIDEIEVALIRRFTPPENSIMFSKDIKVVKDDWIDSGKAIEIPKKYRLQIHSKFGGVCQMCGRDVSLKKIALTKYFEQHDGIKNYVLICRSCRSAMQSSDSFELFRRRKSENIERNIERIDKIVCHYYERGSSCLKDALAFIDDNEIKLWYEYN